MTAFGLGRGTLTAVTLIAWRAVDVTELEAELQSLALRRFGRTFSAEFISAVWVEEFLPAFAERVLLA